MAETRHHPGHATIRWRALTNDGTHWAWEHSAADVAAEAVPTHRDIRTALDIATEDVFNAMALAI